MVMDSCEDMRGHEGSGIAWALFMSRQQMLPDIQYTLR